MTMRALPITRPLFGDVESAYLNQALISGNIAMGQMVELFEKMLHHYFAHEMHVISCSSGTAALHLALSSYDFTQYDEILVPDLAPIAVANAVAYTGARVVPVDVDLETWTISLEDCKRKISNNTAAIMPVHLYGMPCNMRALEDFAEENDLVIIEDAAQALGAKFESMPCGLMGNVGCFSFDVNKMITTAEGGCVVTHDAHLAGEIRLRRDQGQSDDKQFYHEVLGYNYRMSDLHAAIGVAQLSRIDDFIEERQTIFKRYNSVLDLPKQRQQSPEYEIAPWLYTILLENEAQRNLVATRLAEQGIETRGIFIPLHRQPMYQRPDDQFVVSSYIVDRGISLPTYVGMTAEDTTRVASAVNACIAPQMRIVARG